MTHQEASKTVREWAEEYNKQTDCPMDINPLSASNGIDTISATETNETAWECGDDAELNFEVSWS